MDRNVSFRRNNNAGSVSLSARRAWIETRKMRIARRVTASVALRKESVDRNTHLPGTLPKDRRSLSARRAWIETSSADLSKKPLRVALRKESVDRNNYNIVAPRIVAGVALRKESVDRNVEEFLNAGMLDVALRKESVDRNAQKMKVGGIDVSGSLSARRAWIETPPSQKSGR